MKDQITVGSIVRLKSHKRRSSLGGNPPTTLVPWEGHHFQILKIEGAHVQVKGIGKDVSLGEQTHLISDVELVDEA